MTHADGGRRGRGAEGFVVDCVEDRAIFLEVGGESSMGGGVMGERLHFFKDRGPKGGVGEDVGEHPEGSFPCVCVDSV